MELRRIRASLNQNGVIAAYSVPTRTGHARISKQQKTAVIQSSPSPKVEFWHSCKYDGDLPPTGMLFFENNAYLGRRRPVPVFIVCICLRHVLTSLNVKDFSSCSQVAPQCSNIKIWIL